MINITPIDVRKYICPKATDGEIRMFLALCKAQGLNPYVKDVHLIKYSDNAPAQIVTAKQAFMKRLELHPQFDGLQSGIIVQDTTGKVIEREGTFKLDDEKLVGGWAIVYRKDRKIPIKAPVSLRDFDRTASTSEKKNNWNTMPAVMIEKVAIVTAARKACPLELGGLYIADEMPTKSEVLACAETDEIDGEIEPNHNGGQIAHEPETEEKKHGNGGNGHGKPKLSPAKQALLGAITAKVGQDRAKQKDMFVELTGKDSFGKLTDAEAEKATLTLQGSATEEALITKEELIALLSAICESKDPEEINHAMKMLMLEEGKYKDATIANLGTSEVQEVYKIAIQAKQEAERQQTAQGNSGGYVSPDTRAA
ncbi:DNA single-strand annealing protein RecT-like protein [Candidatus Magnetobacterium bavaricum]|uniref:DNA single-strand annealing protein RecT-like protein n=1 Tax=Candidatus Magnetobacterium bavaricum TaxID=29290 RepID=A0A0F3GWD1_9BACT|nr:DNA single-strand annealing protein RecT-like protein [Candidatus Magnetobacterium bavaricum]